MTNSACALAEARKSSNWLTCCDGTRTPNGRRAISSAVSKSLSHGYQHRMPAFGRRSTATAQVLTSIYRLPTTAAIAANPTAKQGKHSQQLPDEIHLQRNY